ncbi:hypothetical protein FXF51_08700 [Nonomuraea sp. PA05]|uniref:hypothetical protein n=1 Tax=Nonomuraea sp. PA05 TaxID=2604466 RepID=UPI0011D8CC65|nr:hypothetical protein [Nonomuraea sp. PA05]TYB69293.1 hypothetical protein FXF51_08700 [Nonomuraea sp. PA05]
MDESTRNVLAQCERELRELRKAMGCTPERLVECPELMNVLQNFTGPGRPRTIQACIDALIDFVKRISDTRHREPLLVALHLDPAHEGDTLARRRGSYVAALRSSRSPLAADVRTIERRENRAIKAAVRLLLENREPDDGGVLAPAHAAGPSFSKDLAIEAISHVCRFSDSGAIVEQEVTRWVRAVVPLADPRILVANRYLAESRPGVLRMESLYGCRVIEQAEDPGGSILATVEILQRLRPDDGIYPFSCRLLIDSRIRSQPVVRWRPPFHHPRRIEFKLLFEPEMVPVRAWWFGATLDIEGQLEPAPSECRHLKILQNGRYLYKVFDEQQLMPNHYYGIAWVWAS